jgi:hypothetical protein
MAFALTALAVAAAGTIGSTVMSAKAAEEQREARRASQRGEQFRAKRERVKQVREALIRQSQIENQAASQGVGGASGAMSGVGSVASQAATNISDIGSQLAIGRTVSRGYGKAQAYSNKAKLISSVAQVGSLGAQTAGSFYTPKDPTLTNQNTGQALQGPPRAGYRAPGDSIFR